ncbi:hypothetical protein IEO21_06074 [Rhodonia placenta]|uniref:Transmembrane protein 188 n=1 Tax=Rhodonia placenta TaxID=104341 RepID=A0A8H7P106_9APHY|nr:hypothetical protein IEO21_06074 [Postia placenta]
MPPRTSSKARQNSFCPAADAATYRDLLLFEERLKTNAASLTRRKHRYELFLAQLLAIIAFLLCEVLLQTDFLAVPLALALRTLAPARYPPGAPVSVHPYIASGLLFVAVTTLVLFFATGMYTEKIGYANRYVPHANRALRSFNMYLNVRQPPLRTKLPFNPLALLFPRTPSAPPPPASGRALSPERAAKRNSSVPIPPIPPASNSRGELIFSSRVERAFREAYERYRGAFERRREERERAAHAATWAGWLTARLRLPWARGPAPAPGQQVAAAGGVSRLASGKVGSARSSPAGSRQGSPGPGSVPGRKARRVSPTGTLHPLAASVRGDVA